MGLAGAGPLIDVHAHFYYAGCSRADWNELNEARLRAGRAIGISCHVASILGSYGRFSPMYFQSPADTVTANDAMLALQRAHGPLIRSYVAVNPNDPGALAEIARCVALGAIGIKLAAARRADDPLVDPLAAYAAEHKLPILHHIWQHRRRFWPNQDASDGAELARLAQRHRGASFILAHIGGGGDYRHTFAAVRDVPNVYLDLSGSGVDRGMLDGALEAVGPGRLLWGADLTLCTGLAKLWALETIGLASGELEAIRWRNAARIFPPQAFASAVGEELRAKPLQTVA
ncbi:MAG TPA: amidohydrolase family protein [Gemmatimonadaceae bacterium]|nr:amidohydrolase family protein [Gemmatimonadaceae bacterium]